MAACSCDLLCFFYAVKSLRFNVVPRYHWSNVMNENEQELNNQVEASDFSDELSDEALDRGAIPGASVPGNTFSCSYPA